jgi:phosphohistidine phosphatase
MPTSERTLVLIRHAKSSWNNPLLSDYNRPLNERGHRDAPEMGRRLADRKMKPDLIIASTARRAAETAKAIAAGVGYPEASIQWVDELYHCVPAVFGEVLAGVAATVKSVFVVAHNPGTSEFAHSLVSGIPAGEVPTCAAVGIQFPTSDWTHLSKEDSKLLFYDTPKK